MDIQSSYINYYSLKIGMVQIHWVDQVCKPEVRVLIILTLASSGHQNKL